MKHILVLPEDDANRQIANGFQAELQGLYIIKDLNSNFDLTLSSMWL